MKPGKDYIGVGCGALIVNGNGEILLLKRSNKIRGSGFWARPGGKVELGERLEDALKREVEEELGVDIKIVRFLDFYEHVVDGEHWVTFGFLAELNSGEVRNLEPEKHEKMEWFSLDKLPENIADYTMSGIRAYEKLLASDKL